MFLFGLELPFHYMTKETVIEIFSDNTSCNIVTVTPVSTSNVTSFTSLSPKRFFFHLAFDCVANFFAKCPFLLCVWQ